MTTEEKLRNDMSDAAAKVREATPLAPSITNTVTINFVANTQLAIGGSAAMIYQPDEGEALAGAAKSFYINVGTIDRVFSETLPRTAKALHEAGNKWVLDPVAVGLGALRTELLKCFKEYKPAIIRGNASEIIGMAKMWGLDAGSAGGNVKGVDSTDEVEAAIPAAVALAKWTGGAVAVSGKEDAVTDGSVLVRCQGGSAMMPKVTGMGCSLGGVCAVFAAVSSPLVAAVAATCAYNIAGSAAEKCSKGTGSFAVEFIDALSNLTPAELAAAPISVRAL